MSLFQRKNFISHSGVPLTWKIECDALTDEDWETLALIISERCSFKSVEGVPTGGLKLAAALQKYCSNKGYPLLIVDDVLTTGKSMWEHRGDRDAVGYVVFARTNRVPSWIAAIWE